jgi:hypothetical protein
MFIESFRLARSIELTIRRDDPQDFPDFILSNPITGEEIWVEIVEAVESGELIAAGNRADRIYQAAAREYRRGGRFRSISGRSSACDTEPRLWSHRHINTWANEKSIDYRVDNQGTYK